MAQATENQGFNLKALFILSLFQTKSKFDKKNVFLKLGSLFAPPPSITHTGTLYKYSQLAPHPPPTRRHAEAGVHLVEHEGDVAGSADSAQLLEPVARAQQSSLVIGRHCMTECV